MRNLMHNEVVFNVFYNGHTFIHSLMEVLRETDPHAIIREVSNIKTGLISLA